MDTLSWPALIRALIQGESLHAGATEWAMNEIMDGAASPAQIAGFGVALRAKGETAEEMSGLAAAMLAHATPITIDGPVTDLVGTGGDGAHTVNVSTMATIVAAAAGGRMVKHGNRAASSACGAADVLEALGVVIDLPSAATEALFAELGVAFLFAPVYHPAFRHTGPVRRELGVPTAFNYLGPLTNPARPTSLAVGVADPRMGPVLAGVLAARGNSAIVFHGEGLDELTTTGPSSVWVVADGAVSPAGFDPASLGLPRASLADLRGGDAPHNAAVVRAVLSGERGPVRDIVLLNAAAALAAAEGLSFVTATPATSPTRGIASTLTASSTPDASSAPETSSAPEVSPVSAMAVADALTKALTDGLARAAEAIDSGAAQALLARWSETSRRLAASH
jgi:anthranilate phosphoribosyltransferase